MARVELQQQVSLTNYYRDITIQYPIDWEGFKSGQEEDEYFSIGPTPRILTLDEINYAQNHILQKRIRATISLTGAVIGPPDDPLYQWTHEQLDRLEEFLGYSNSRYIRAGGTNNTLNRICQVRERGYQYDGSELPALPAPRAPQIVNTEQELPPNGTYVNHAAPAWDGANNISVDSVSAVIEDISQITAESKTATWFSEDGLSIPSSHALASSSEPSWLINYIEILKSSEASTTQTQPDWQANNALTVGVLVNSVESGAFQSFWETEAFIRLPYSGTLSETATSKWQINTKTVISGIGSSSLFDSISPTWETEAFIKMPHSEIISETIVPEWQPNDRVTIYRNSSFLDSVTPTWETEVFIRLPHSEIIVEEAILEWEFNSVA
jgi:hypothetical protein